MLIADNYILKDKIKLDQQTIIFDISYLVSKEEGLYYLRFEDNYKTVFDYGIRLSPKLSKSVQDTDLDFIKSIVIPFTFMAVIDEYLILFNRVRTDNIHFVFNFGKLSQQSRLLVERNLHVAFLKWKYLEPSFPRYVSYTINIKEVEQVSLSNFENIGVDNIYTIGTNGGKDSTLANLIMKEVYGEGYVVNYLKEVEYSLLSNSESTSVFWKIINKQLDEDNFYDENTRIDVVTNTQAYFQILFVLPLIEYYLVHRKFPRYIVLGTEWGCSGRYSMDGHYDSDIPSSSLHIPELPYDEGFFIYELFEEYKKIYLLKVDTEIISPIAGINEPTIIHSLILLKDYTYSAVKSCWNREFWFMDTDYSCGLCNKCQRNKLIFKSLHKVFDYKKDIFGNQYEDLIIKTSPTAYSCSVAYNDIYKFMLGETTESINENNFIAIYESRQIIKFSGGENLYKKICNFLAHIGIQVVSEPKPSFNLEYIDNCLFIKELLTKTGVTNYWADLAGLQGDYDKIFNNIVLPEELELMSYYNCNAIYSFYNVLRFYEEEEDVLITLEGYKHKFLREGVVPSFRGSIFEKSLLWGKDKQSQLDKAIAQKIITGYKIERKLK